MPLQIHSRSAITLTAPHTIPKSFTRLWQACPPPAHLPYMQSLSRSGLLESRLRRENDPSDRLNPYLLGAGVGKSQAPRPPKTSRTAFACELDAEAPGGEESPPGLPCASRLLSTSLCQWDAVSTTRSSSTAALEGEDLQATGNAPGDLSAEIGRQCPWIEQGIADEGEEIVKLVLFQIEIPQRHQAWIEALQYGVDRALAHG